MHAHLWLDDDDDDDDDAAPSRESAMLGCAGPHALPRSGTPPPAVAPIVDNKGVRVPPHQEGTLASSGASPPAPPPFFPDQA